MIRNENDYLSRVLKIEPLVFIGNISTEIFLIHYLVIHLTRKVFSIAGVNEVSEWIFIFEFMTTVLLSLCWKKFEKRLES